MVADEEIDPPVKANIDQTPKLQDQAAEQGWEAKVFDFGKAEDSNVDIFNPGLVKRPDGLWLMARRATFQHSQDMFGMNRIWACKLNPDLTPHGGKLLTWPDTIEDSQQFEDARCFYHGGTNKTWISACNFIWHGDGSWTGAHQTIGEFNCTPQDEETDWVGVRRIDPDIEGNGTDVHTRQKHQKNWVWFNFENRLHLLYSTHPWSIIGFGDTWTDNKPYFQKDGVQWDYGLIRGGSPPVQVGDLFWTFFHSSMPWTGRFRRYFMGALAFEAKPPFKPVYVTPKPLLVGSQQDVWRDRKPLVVFPCGSVIENDIWLVTYGINDLKSGYIKIPHADLVSKSQKIAKKFAPSLMLNLPKAEQSKTVAPVLSRAEQKKQVLRERAAKAREKLAEMRRNGTLKTKKRRKRRVISHARLRSTEKVKKEKNPGKKLLESNGFPQTTPSKTATGRKGLKEPSLVGNGSVLGG